MDWNLSKDFSLMPVTSLFFFYTWPLLLSLILSSGTYQLWVSTTVAVLWDEQSPLFLLGCQTLGPLPSAYGPWCTCELAQLCLWVEESLKEKKRASPTAALVLHFLLAPELEIDFQNQYGGGNVATFPSWPYLKRTLRKHEASAWWLMRGAGFVY